MIKFNKQTKIASITSIYNLCCMQNNNNKINKINNINNINNINKISILNNIKSKYILQQVFSNIKEKKKLEINKYNKNLQNKLEINIDDFKNFHFRIEIEITIYKLENCNFKDNITNFLNNINSSFNVEYKDKNKEKYKNLSNFENIPVGIEKIKLINKQRLKNYSKFFSKCGFIDSINFIKFKETDIKNMSYMFNGCSNLKEIKGLKNFNTGEVTNMSHMFEKCYNLLNLDLSALD